MKLGFQKNACSEILTENLCMRHVAAKSVPRLLTEERQQSALKSVKHILSVQTMMKTYVKKVITGEEKWVYGYMMSKQKNHS
jgi:predicted hydrolase (HD superfamily)